ncbi:TetR family transcriptional regulator [Halobellus ordinarius]|uniref:TetR family transcriptional regulator n=1 Tax=Halobellus ordinarius TaxID=3075120 RepID=UPI0028806646|nr:TetR family transcriptional regulator [Halobellus sp. ZY16]
MAESKWPQHALRVGVFEFRRSVRAIWQDKARAFLMAAGLVFPSLMLVGFIYLFSGAIRNVGTVSLPPVARGTVALLWLFGVFIATQRVVSARPRIDAEQLMLTTVSARTVVGGLLVAETLRVLAYLGLPVVVLTGGVVYLFGSLVSMLLIPLAAILLGLTAVLVGMVLGYAIALLIATSPFVARHKTVLGGIAVVVAIGGYLLITLPQFGGVGQESLAVLPVGWFVDLAVIGSPAQGSMTRAGVAVGGSLLVVIGGIVLVEREATRLWFTDPVSGEKKTDVDPEHTTPEQDGTRTVLADAIVPLGIPRGVSQPTRRVAQWTLLRTRRDPRRLNFLLLPVVMVGSGLFSSGMQAASPWMVFAPAAAVLLPWMAGATFAMNPLGDEGTVLPVTLISVSGASYVRGLMLPGLLFGIPIVVLVTAGAALVGPFELPVAIGLVGVSLLTTLVAVTTAPAVGLWFPRFSAISIGQSREVIPPRLLTTALHFLGVTIPATVLVVLLIEPQLGQTLIAGITGFLPAALVQLATGGDGDILSDVGVWFQNLGTAIQSIGLESFQLTAGGLLVFSAVIVAVVSYRVAIRRFDSYSPPT